MRLASEFHNLAVAMPIRLDGRLERSFRLIGLLFTNVRSCAIHQVTLDLRVLHFPITCHFATLFPDDMGPFNSFTHLPNSESSNNHTTTLDSIILNNTCEKMADLTPRGREILVMAWQCLKTPPEVC